MPLETGSDLTVISSAADLPAVWRAEQRRRHLQERQTINVSSLVQ